jgi:outer membrane immunogenic protein
MKTLRIVVLSTIVSSAFALAVSTANADGYQGRMAQAPPALSSWTGFYVGINAGGVQSDVSWANVDLTGEPVNNDSFGFIGGAQVGYNVEMNGIVVGAEATVSGTTLRDNFRSVVNPAAVTYSTDIRTIATVTGRMGIAAANHLLIYAKAGWAGANVSVSGRQSAIPDSFDFTEWRNGWTAGGGAEFKLSSTMSVGIEYGFIDLGSQNYTGTTAVGFPVAITNHDVQIQSVTARLNLKLPVK